MQTYLSFNFKNVLFNIHEPNGEKIKDYYFLNWRIFLGSSHATKNQAWSQARFF